jgi:diguanylate cyclase (GGDEF)-like protein
VLLGLVYLAEFFGVIPHQEIPFSNPALADQVTYLLVRYMWQVTVLFGTASVAIIGTRAMASPEESGEAVIDPVTCLYSRTYFRRALNAELGRSRREHRPAHVLLVDIDQFGEFNRRFGIDRGDVMLKAVADAVRRSVATVGDVELSTNVAARYGGEEFAILLVEDLAADTVPDVETAKMLAEDLRRAVGKVRVDDAGITVSVGVATFPVDGQTPEELLEAADEALVAAAEAGGDRVRFAAHGPVALGV